MIRLALPTGDLRNDTAAMLDAVGLGIPDYAAGSRALRFPMLDGAGIARVFREKDIPVQVALGNYDIGICGLAWVEELTRGFPVHEVVLLGELDYGKQSIWVTSAGDTTEASVRIASEYPNIAETLARRLRLRRYRVFPLHGAAEAYPPEDADVVLVPASDPAEIERTGLRPLGRVLSCSAWIIANRHSLASRKLAPFLSRLAVASRPGSSSPPLTVPDSLGLREGPRSRSNRIRLALPDGHAQAHTVAALRAAGIGISGYDEKTVTRRPQFVGDTEIEVKVIRPQDMPQHVALGQFDLAVTGRDVLFDHLVQFPSSPVEEIVDLRRSRYSLAAIVKDVDADNVAGALQEWRARDPDAPIRVASEYPNIADHFARDRHFGRYSVIPIAGAAEGFVPDDAEILIEGIETGSSVRANKLTVLERFFESTNCVIANKHRPHGPARLVFDALVERLAAAAAEPVTAGGA